MSCPCSGSIVGLIATSSKRTYATCCPFQDCCCRSPCNPIRILLTHASAGDLQTFKARSGSLLLSHHPGVHRICLCHPSISGTWGGGLILKVIAASYHLIVASPLPLVMGLFFLLLLFNYIRSVRTDIHQYISSNAQSCQTLCDPMDCSTPGLLLQHQLPENTQTHVYWVSDAIQPSQNLPSPTPPAFNLSQHQGLFKWVSSSHQVAKVLEFQVQHQSFQWIFRTDFL